MVQTDLAPEWLNASVFEDVLRDIIPDYNRVITLNAQGALSGKSNICHMLRVNIELQLKDRKKSNVSFLIKLPPTSTEAKEIASAAFKNELTTYHELLPAFQKIFQQSGKELQFAPNCFRFEKNIAIDAILLADLKPKGYRNANSSDGLNTIHTKAVLEKLAAFHAASAVYCERNGHLPKIYTEPPIKSKQQAYFEASIIASNRKFVECLRKHDLREYQDKMKMYQLSFAKLHMKAEKADPSEFNVLTHGDCWSSNIMFKYDAFGNIIDTVFINFQISKYGSPVRDLVYFILTSTRLEDKLARFDYFIKYYHDQLTSSLKLLSYSKKIPKLTDLHLSILRYSSFAFMAVSKVLPIVLLEPTKQVNMDIDNIMDYNTYNRDMLNLMFENPRYGEHLKQILPWLENRALLED